MTRKFDEAKAEAIRKYTKVSEAISIAMLTEARPCNPDCTWATCDDCSVREYCRGKPHNDIRMSIWELNLKIIERLDFLTKLEWTEEAAKATPSPGHILPKSHTRG